MGGERSRRSRGCVLLVILGTRLAVAAPAPGADPVAELLGARVHLVDPRMAQADIQQLVDGVAARQVDNQFGPERDAVLFEPGTYGSTDHPLIIPVGYYTQVSGLGADPRAVLIHGRIQVRNRCFKGACVALDNFWRAASNLSLQVSSVGTECGDAEIWAVSQAAPLRRLHVTGGDVQLADRCSAPSWSSGGFIADSVFEGVVDNGTQQQFLTRNSDVRRWVGSNWNQVFAGVRGELPRCPPAADCPFIALPASPVIREAPYLYVDAHRQWRVYHPAVRSEAVGTSWADGHELGASRALRDFFIATPESAVGRINQALRAGKSLLLTPGVYRLEAPLQVTRPDTVILGLGFPTLIPERGTAALEVHASHGVAVAGVLVEAGARHSPLLVKIGDDGAGDGADPTSLHDVFFRIGGAAAGSAGVSLQVNSSHTILDHIWAWRADHGEGVGWTINRADTGLVVNGAEVTAYGLFVEHYQKQEVLWNGESGRVVFFQNEMPYDPPSQAEWRTSAAADGYAALTVAPGVRRFNGAGWGSYCYFNKSLQDPIYADRAFNLPASLPPGSVLDLFTIFLNAKTLGGIRHVVNDKGGAALPENADKAQRVNSFP